MSGDVGGTGCIPRDGQAQMSGVRGVHDFDVTVLWHGL